MDFNNIYHVENVSDTIIVNLLLKHGWKVMNVIPEAYWEQPGFQNSTLCYAVGAEKGIFEKYSLNDAMSEYKNHKWSISTDD